MYTSLKTLIFTTLISLISSEPPIQGLSAPFYQPPSTNYGTPISNYESPSNSYIPPSNSYIPPSNSYIPPSNSYNPPSNNYGPPSNTYLPSNGYDNQDHAHEHAEPKAYEFGYSVKDAQSGNDYNRHETSDGHTVRGEYRVALPDGRTQIVSYWADWKSGYHADVRYEGEAHYPEPQRQQQGYNYAPPPAYSGSLSGFGYNKPSQTYGPPGYKK